MPRACMRASCDAARPCSCTSPPAFSRRTSTSSPSVATASTALTSSRSEAVALARMSPRKSITNTHWRRCSRAAFSSRRRCLASFLRSAFGRTALRTPSAARRSRAFRLLTFMPSLSRARRDRFTTAATTNTMAAARVTVWARNSRYCSRVSITARSSLRLGAGLQPDVVLLEDPVGAIAGAHQGARHDFKKSHLQADAPVFRKLLRRDVAFHGQVMPRRAQVLPEGHDVHLARLEVPQRLDDLRVRLAQAQHQAGLGEHARPVTLGVLQHGQRLL